ncbi:hypothetical protein KCU78_g18313, partial [Aureobasidium melanogenum]
MATQPSQTPAETSQSSQILSSFDLLESQSEYSAPLTTLAPSSELNIPTEFQRPDDFRSTAAHTDTSRTVRNLDYYKDVDFTRLYWRERDGSKIQLEGCLNGKGASKSWIFNYGWRMQVQGVVPEAYYWVCRSCYNKRITRCAFSVGYGTAPGIKHLSTHNITVHGEGQAKRSRLSSSFAASSNKSSSHGQDIERYGTVFHPAAWKARVVALICHDNHAFQLFESPYLQDLLLSLNPSVGQRGCLATHKTIASWISQVYNSHMGIVTEKLHAATSKIHLSFDLWTSRNLRALLGVNCHFADEFGNLKTFLLALPQQLGQHSGVNIADQITAIIEHFNISESIGYFMTDNATNNDTCIEALGLEHGFNPLHRRLRCSGHKINLVARAMLWGVDEEAFENELAAIDLEDHDLSIWRKQGPLGKMRNTIIWIRSSPQRNEAFKQLQQDHPLISKISELHVPNDTRWNSMWDAIDVFIKLRPAVEDFYHKAHAEWQDYWNKITDHGRKPPLEKRRKKPAFLDDFITQDDWSIIVIYNGLLQPLYQVTQRLEGKGGGASHGAIWQVIPAMEKLLTHLEVAKQEYSIVRPTQDYTMVNSQTSTVFDAQDLHEPVPAPVRAKRGRPKQSQSQSQSMPPPPPTREALAEDPFKNTIEYRMLCVGINLAWQKLDEYYSKTDQSPVYVAAVVLHPGLKWKWLEKAWRGRPSWISQARVEVKKLWLEYANIIVTTEDTESLRVEDNARWMDDDLLSDFSDIENDASTDEYQKWCEEGRQPNVYRPLEFWSTQRQKQTYPRLSRMARDLFTIPAMSDEPERIFSSAGLMTTPHRGRLSARAIGEAQCVKSWLKTGIITSLEGTFENVAMYPIDMEIED